METSDDAEQSGEKPETGAEPGLHGVRLLDGGSKVKIGAVVEVVSNRIFTYTCELFPSYSQSGLGPVTKDMLLRK